MYHNLQFRLPILPSLLLILLQSETVVRCCSAKRVFLQISQNSQENTKKKILAQMLSCEFCEISFLKKTSDGCFSISTRSVYCPIRLFKNDVTHIFWLSIFFFGLICRLGTRLSWIFQALGQKPIFNPVARLRWSLFLRK